MGFRASCMGLRTVQLHRVLHLDYCFVISFLKFLIMFTQGFSHFNFAPSPGKLKGSVGRNGVENKQKNQCGSRKNKDIIQV
jgi:hypothetical protein